MVRGYSRGEGVKNEGGSSLGERRSKMRGGGKKMLLEAKHCFINQTKC